MRLPGRLVVALSLAAALATRSTGAERSARLPRESWREAFKTFAIDGRYLVTFPSRTTAKGAWLKAAVIAATGLTMNRDEAIRNNVLNSDRPGATRIATKFEPLGKQEVEAAALGALYLA